MGEGGLNPSCKCRVFKFWRSAGFGVCYPLLYVYTTDLLLQIRLTTVFSCFLYPPPSRKPRERRSGGRGAGVDAGW